MRWDRQLQARRFPSLQKVQRHRPILGDLPEMQRTGIIYRNLQKV
jgi:hypothetical protein